MYPSQPMLLRNNQPYLLITGEVLKKQRIEANLPMRVLGKRLSVPHSFISKVENAERRIDIGEFIIYCESLGLNPAVTLANIQLSANYPDSSAGGPGQE